MYFINFSILSKCKLSYLCGKWLSWFNFFGGGGIEMKDNICEHCTFTLFRNWCFCIVNIFFFNRVFALDLPSLLSKQKWVCYKHVIKNIFLLFCSLYEYNSHSVIILQYDFTMWGGLLFVFLIILILFGLFAAIFHTKVRTEYWLDI